MTYQILQHYQLERDPFSNQGIEGLFYSGGSRRDIVELLLHFSRYGSAPLFLSGMQGVGKTTVLKEFERNVESDIDIGVVSLELMRSDEKILEELLDDLHVPIDSDLALEENLKLWLKEQFERDRKVVICFDNVEHLSKTIIEQFLVLVADDNYKITLVFVGETDAQDMLERMVESHDLLLNTIELKSLNKSEVAEYILYRMASAGYQGKFPLTEMQLQAVTLRSAGNINKLNELARDMLETNAGTHPLPAETKKPFPLMHMAGALAIGVVTLWFAWYTLDTKDHEEELAITLETVEEEKVKVAGDNEIQTPQIQTSISEEQVIEVDNVEQQVSDVVSEENDSSLDNLGDSDSDDESVSLVENSDTANTVIAKAKAEHEKFKNYLAQNATQEQEVVEQIEEIDSIMADKTPDTSELELTENDDDISVAYQRIDSWPASSYALQLFGTHNSQRAYKLVEQYKEKRSLLVYETVHNDKPWFVVLDGPFMGRQAAQKGIEDLPDGLQRLRPWPRNVASIKRDVERFRSLN